jgi:hypothetical protein
MAWPTVGQVLRIPAVVVTSTNNDDGTFEAYDPTAIIGDTTPVIPQPPKKKKNILKQIIIVVAAVVVAYFTGQWYLTNYGTVATATTTAASSLGAGVTLTGSAATTAVAAGTATAASFTAGSLIAAGAISGAVASIAGQLTGMALGEQDKFSWKQVGLGALGGGITGGLSQVGALTNQALGGAFQGAVTRAVIGNALTQGIGVATGLQEQFSWRGVALSAVSAGVTYGVGQALASSGAFNGAFGETGGQIARSVASRLVGSTVAQAVTNKGGKVNVGQIAADAFGSVIADAFIGQIEQASQQAQRAAFSQAAANAMDAEYGIYNRNDDWAHQAQQQAHLQRAGFIDAGRDMMGPESGVWGQQAAFANEALTQRSEDMRDAAMAQMMGSSPSPADNRSLLNAVERGINPGAYTSVAGRTVRAPNNGLGISSLIGTSNPQAVGNFMRANGMTNDNLQGGRNYFIPDSTTAYGNSTGLGQYALNLGNARAVALANSNAVPAGVAGTAAPYDDLQRLMANSAARGLAGPSAVDLIPRTGGFYAAPPSTMTAEELRGQQIQQINRAFTTAKNNGDVAAMRRLSESYKSIQGSDPSSAMNVVQMNMATGRGVINSGEQLDAQSYGPAALAALGAGMVGVVQPGSKVPTIDGRRPINSEYAGGVHPSGIRYNEYGFPDFSPVAKAAVQIKGLTGVYSKDAAMANQAVGLSRTPNGFVWHHVEDGLTMQLIPTAIHNATRHTGGSAVIRNGGFDR